MIPVPKPSLQMLFTTSRVVTAVYRIVSTTILLAYLARRRRGGDTYRPHDVRQYRR